MPVSFRIVLWVARQSFQKSVKSKIESGHWESVYSYRLCKISENFFSTWNSKMMTISNFSINLYLTPSLSSLLIGHPGTLAFYLSKMKKFLHFGMVIVIVVLFFCVKCDENKKALFLKFYFCCLNICSYNQQNPKIERKTKKKCWSKFRGKRRLLAEWRDNAWIMALFVFFSKFLPFFCFSFIRWILCFWWSLCYILKDQYYYSPKRNIFFF